MAASTQFEKEVLQSEGELCASYGEKTMLIYNTNTGNFYTVDEKKSWRCAFEGEVLMMHPVEGQVGVLGTVTVKWDEYKRTYSEWVEVDPIEAVDIVTRKQQKLEAQMSALTEKFECELAPRERGC